MILCSEDGDIAVGIMTARFVGGFCMHRIGKESVVVSLYGMKEIPGSESISLENFVIRQVCEICAIAHLVKDFSYDDVYNFVHKDTRGRVFDLNGDQTDVLYYTDWPKLCSFCKEGLGSR